MEIPLKKKESRLFLWRLPKFIYPYDSLWSEIAPNYSANSQSSLGETATLHSCLNKGVIFKKKIISWQAFRRSIPTRITIKKNSPWLNKHTSRKFKQIWKSQRKPIFIALQQIKLLEKKTCPKINPESGRFCGEIGASVGYKFVEVQNKGHWDIFVQLIVKLDRLPSWKYLPDILKILGWF